VCIASALLPESTLSVPVMFRESRVIRHAGTPATLSGVGVSVKHWHAAWAEHVPVQSALALHGAWLLHLGSDAHELPGQSAFDEHVCENGTTQWSAHVPATEQSASTAHGEPWSGPGPHVGQSAEESDMPVHAAFELLQRQLSAAGSIPFTPQLPQPGTGGPWQDSRTSSFPPSFVSLPWAMPDAPRANRVAVVQRPVSESHVRGASQSTLELQAVP